MKTPIKQLGRLLLREENFMAEVLEAKASHKLSEARNELLQHVRQTGKSNDLSLIVETEKTILENDLERHANSSGMSASLRSAMADFSSLENHIEKVSDPIQYAQIDEAHILEKNRKGGLPYDEGRQALSSNLARLDNLGRARLSDSEKDLLNARKDNMKLAEKLYINMQAAALGVKLAPEAAKTPKSKGKGAEIGD